MIFRRRKYLVNTGLQMKITLSFLAVSLFGSVAATIAFNYLAMKKLETVMWSTHINVKDTGEIIRPLFLYVNIIDFLFVFVLLTFAVLWMMRKTKGPLIRMSKDLMKVADGDLSVILALRRKDEFQDTAYELNCMISSMRDRFKKISKKHSYVSESITGLKYEINDPENVIKICDSALENIKDIEEELMSFEIGRNVR